MLRLVFFFVVLFAKSLEALYSGNPDEPELIDTGIFFVKDEAFGVKTGYQGDFIFDRKLYLKGLCTNVDQFSSRMNQGVATVNFLNRCEVFGTLGAKTASFSFRLHKDEKQREFQTDDDLTWGAGARLLLFNWGNAQIGATGSYQYWHPSMKWNSLNCKTVSTCAKLKYWEWQVAALIAYRVDMFDPYIGISYASVEVELSSIHGSDLDLPCSTIKMKGRERVGFAVGCSLTPSKIVDLTAEVRFFNEEALTLAGNIRF